jgi:hypothetical protein
MQGPYNSPESYGLTMVGSVEWSDEPYEFHITAVWRDETGSWYHFEDSGCSCPMPFESVTRDSLVPTTRAKVIEHLIAMMYDFPYGANRAGVLIERLMSL